MTDPNPTRAEVEALVAHNKALIDRNVALRERAEAAEAERKAADFRLVDRYRNPKTGIFNFPDDVAAIVRALDAARRAEAAAWNDAIEAAYQACLTCDGPLNNAGAAAMKVRALRRAAPTEGEA